MTLAVRIFALCAALVIFDAAAHAQSLSTSNFQVNPNQPISVNSDTLEIIEQGNLALFKGNVQVIQGSLSIRASTVRVTYGQSSDGSGRREIDTVEAVGDTTVIGGGQSIQANRLVYRLSSRTVEVTGDVRIQQGESSLLADKLTVNFDDGTVVMRGGEGGQVQAVLGREQQ